MPVVDTVVPVIAKRFHQFRHELVNAWDLLEIHPIQIVLRGGMFCRWTSKPSTPEIVGKGYNRNWESFSEDFAGQD